MRSGTTRYEIYLPKTWKKLLYDLYEDPNDFYKEAVGILQVKYNRNAYDNEIVELMEQLIFNNGYTGYFNSSLYNPLPHAIAIFYKVNTQSPTGSFRTYDWDDKMLAETVNPFKFSDSFFDDINPTKTNLFLKETILFTVNQDIKRSP